MTTRSILANVFVGALVAISCFSLPAQAQFYGDAQNNNDEELLAPSQRAPAGPSPTDVQIRLQAMDAQLRAMQGTVEKLQFRNQQLEQQLGRSASDYDVRFQMIEKRLGEHDAAIRAIPPPAPPPPPAAAIPETPAATDAPKPDASLITGPPSTEATIKTLGTIHSEKGGAEKDAQALYDQAFASLRQTKYDDAERDFRQFLKNNPKHRLTENAKYWLAETYYVRGKYSESAVAFAETYQEFPQGSKAPDNLLKLAMSLAGVGKKQDACLTLGELKKRFPSAAANIRTRAEQQTKTLNCAI